MKDYMGELERERYCMFLVALKIAGELLESSLFSKEEKSNLKRCITWGRKVNLLEEGRLNKSASKTLLNMMNNGHITYMDKYGSQLWDKKKSANIKDKYEENKEYFELVEMIFHYNCRGCQKCDYKTCDFYKVFEQHMIPEMQVNEPGKCKFFYEEI
ncbi:DUF5651 domain-containing protein [Clostridium saudiense]|uniref:DUF5651 domain-containing protein n=1 Tax=Clostridium saudiense TaxID=1414720 RepID=UPI0018ABAB86|nr:DUF5651 domain-containing protein [Clostridium saudiense]